MSIPPLTRTEALTLMGQVVQTMLHPHGLSIRHEGSLFTFALTSEQAAQVRRPGASLSLLTSSPASAS